MLQRLQLLLLGVCAASLVYGWFEGPSFAYSLPVHSFHTRRDRVASLTTRRLHGAAIQRASPLRPGRALTLPCGWNNAGLYLFFAIPGPPCPLLRIRASASAARTLFI